MRCAKAARGVAVVAAHFLALERASSLHAFPRSLHAFSTLAAALAASLAGSTLAGAFGIATRPHPTRDEALERVDEMIGFRQSVEGYRGKASSGHNSELLTGAVAWPSPWSTPRGSRGT